MADSFGDAWNHLAAYKGEYRCWPIKLCPNAGSIVIKDHLCPFFADDHAFSSKLAIFLVQTDMTDVRNCPTVGRR